MTDKGSIYYTPFWRDSWGVVHIGPPLGKGTYCNRQFLLLKWADNKVEPATCLVCLTEKRT